jgi:hypothetical protein
VNSSVVVGSYPESRVRNSQPHGIGRVAALDGLCAWNNLGRNVVFADEAFRPRAVFDESVFTEDEPSQYDLDVHAILEIPGAGIVLMLNHLGMLRAFHADEIRRPGPLRRVRPLWTRMFAADVERAAVVGARLVGSRPREEHAGGLLVSEPLTATADKNNVDVTVQLDTWGKVTALTALASDDDNQVALGGDGRVSLSPATDEGVGRPRWTVDVGFEPAALLWDGAVLWAAGSERSLTGIDDYDWEAMRGGGFAGLDPTDGRVIVRGRFPDDLAWGNGGVAVVMLSGTLCAIGRTGQVHVFDRRDGSTMTVTESIANQSLGIVHAAAVGDHVLYGFNRGGYELHAVAVGTIL